MQHIAWKRGLGVLRNLEQTRLTYRELNWYVVSTAIIKIVGQLTNPRLEFKNLHKFFQALGLFRYNNFIGGKFDRCIHAWICKFYSCTLCKNCIKKLFKLSEPLLFVQCWIYEGRKGKQGIMFCLRPGLTSEWSVFKELCILLYACLPSPSARRRWDEKSSASTILTRETS